MNYHQQIKSLFNSNKLDDLVMKDISMISDSSQSSNQTLFPFSNKIYPPSVISLLSSSSIVTLHQNENLSRDTQESFTQITPDEINNKPNNNQISFNNKFAIKRVFVESKFLGLVFGKVTYFIILFLFCFIKVYQMIR